MAILLTVAADFIFPTHSQQANSRFLQHFRERVTSAERVEDSAVHSRGQESVVIGQKMVPPESSVQHAYGVTNARIF